MNKEEIKQERPKWNKRSIDHLAQIDAEQALAEHILKSWGYSRIDKDFTDKLYDMRAAIGCLKEGPAPMGTSIRRQEFRRVYDDWIECSQW